jgi:hypothetical protein
VTAQTESAPLLAGLLEVMPWVRQWHNEPDPDFGQSCPEAHGTYLTTQRESRNLTEDALRAWLPPQPTRGRRTLRFSRTVTTILF